MKIRWEMKILYAQKFYVGSFLWSLNYLPYAKCLSEYFWSINFFKSEQTINIFVAPFKTCGERVIFLQLFQKRVTLKKALPERWCKDSRENISV